jgi:ethanolamine utilization protein EutQ (cupin superfamily)
MTDTPATTRPIERFAIDEARDWMEWSGIALADVANEDDVPEMKLGAVGFLRAPRGVRSQFEFAYDEVLVVTSGRCTVRGDGVAVSVSRGEAVYLPAGTPGAFEADEELELVYVASSPYGEVNRGAKAELLGEARR